MSMQWLRSLCRRITQPRALPDGFVPAVESLEDRCLLSGTRFQRPAPPISELVIIGDSLSDRRNTNDLTGGLAPSPGSAYTGGRFSNGPLWVEYLATDLGIAVATASRDGGTNHAYGGARTGPGFTTQVFFDIPNTSTQVADYLASHTPAGDELFVVWAGGNDLPGVDPAVMAANLANDIATLAAASATRFLVPNLPPLGSTPSHSGDPTIDALTAQFNALLEAELVTLESSLNITIFSFDVNQIFLDVLNDPAEFGLTNVTDPAITNCTLFGCTIVPNPEEYLFWDDLHPTTVAHQFLGEEAALIVAPTSTFLYYRSGERFDRGSGAAPLVFTQFLSASFSPLPGPAPVADPGVATALISASPKSQMVEPDADPLVPFTGESSRDWNEFLTEAVVHDVPSARDTDSPPRPEWLEVFGIQRFDSLLLND